MRIGVEKKSSCVPVSRSRSTGLATNAVVTKTPSRLITSSNCRMTNGALRSTFPIEPPMTTASVVTARNADRKKNAAASRKTGCRNW